MTYTHNTPVLVRQQGAGGYTVPGAIDDHLHPSERANRPPQHHCVRFADGGRLFVAERDLQLIPEVIR